MATLCPSCGSRAPDTAGVCSACGWDFVAKKLVGKPAGLDLFLKPPAPGSQQPGAVQNPPPSSVPARPVDMAPPPRPEEKPKPEPPPLPVPTTFPSNYLNPALEYIRRKEAGRELLLDPRAQAVVAKLREPRVFIAAVSGLAFLLLLMIYIILPSRGPAAPPVAVAPVDTSDHVHPMATFADTPKTVITGPYAAPARPAPMPAPAPVAAPAPAPAPAPATAPPQGPPWVFEGTVFDLLSTHGVYAAKLIFVDARGAVAGQTETDTAGRYKITLPSGDGYTLKIEHVDYSGRYIDDNDPRRSLRNATLAERGVLMQAAAHNHPWVGKPDKAVSRSLALIPRMPEEP